MTETKSINSNQTQETNSEQLLKLIEVQLAEARKRRLAREAGRGKAGLVGIFVIVGAAVVALWVLSVMLEQMRPHRGDRGENVGDAAVEGSR
jgi:hypothetical protein